jgi:hypothetical protein
MIRGNTANPFFEGPPPDAAGLTEAAERVLSDLGKASPDEFPIHTDSYGVRFFLAPGRRQHRLFALVWDGRMWRTGGEWAVPRDAFTSPAWQSPGR